MAFDGEVWLVLHCQCEPCNPVLASPESASVLWVNSQLLLIWHYIYCLFTYITVNSEMKECGENHVYSNPEAVSAMKCLGLS